MKIDVQWTKDCQGKQDYDADILSISSRFYPRGGGFHFFDSRNPNAGLQGNEARPEIKPSASSSLLLRYQEPDGSGEDLTLAEAEFEAETEEEVKSQVEKWAQDQMDRVVTLLKNEFQVG
jgi:hypothetical protein